MTGSALIARSGVAAIRDRRLLAHAVAWTGASMVALGIATAIIPNPVFGRGLPPEPFAIAVWAASGPLMGLILATYTAPPAVATSAPEPLVVGRPDGSRIGAIGGMAAFLAIGCPTCNKVALLLLGTGGAASVFGPLQPFIGAASVLLLAASLLWRLRLRAQGGSCAT